MFFSATRLSFGRGGLFFFCLLPVLLWVSSALALDGAAKTPLALENNNLACTPYECSIKINQGQRLSWVDDVQYPIVKLIEQDEIVRYYFISSDIVDIPAYSGKPVQILIGISPDGVIEDIRLVSHKEPILLVGIPEQTLIDFVSFYKGKNILDKIKVGKPEAGYTNVDIITGATVTVLVSHQTIERASRTVATEVGIIDAGAISYAELTTTYQSRNWKQLLRSGAIGRLTIDPTDMDLPPSDEVWLDLYFADLMHPTIGQNLLGENTYSWLMDHLKPGESALAVMGRGTWSFKGSGFARGGIYDRFHIEQGLNSFTFRDLDFENLYTFEPDDAPDLRELGIFIIRDAKYDNTRPWEMVILGNRLTGETATSKIFKTFRKQYQLPDSLIKKKASMLQQVWSEKKLSVVWYIALWFLAISIFVFRKIIVKDGKRLERLHNLVLLTCVITIGIYHGGQPSVVNIFTLVDVARHASSFKLFFIDPFLAIGWIFIVLTVIFWGRPLFCGWICPYGAIQELLFFLRKRLTPWKKSVEFPEKVRAVLKPLRYIILAVLFCVSLVSLQMAEIMAEIEPFKTTWNVGVLNRPVQFGIYWSILLVAALFTERFYCRFVCPLGAALSLASWFPRLPIPRRNFCTNCVKCAKGCSTHAINEQGEIDAKECLGCLECMEQMYDPKACPPLVSIKTWNEYEAHDPKAPSKS